MTDNTGGAFERLMRASLEKCLARLSGVSAGTWEILGISVSLGTVEDAVKQHDFKRSGAAVYFNLKELPLPAIMLVDPADMECISKCFMGYSYPRGAATTQAEEVMLLELGNIILNSLINSVLNALKKSGMPSVPAYVEGDFARVLGGLGAGLDLKKNFRIVTAALAIRSDKCSARSELLLLIPEELELPPEQPPA